MPSGWRACRGGVSGGNYPITSASLAGQVLANLRELLLDGNEVLDRGAVRRPELHHDVNKCRDVTHFVLANKVCILHEGFHVDLKLRKHLDHLGVDHDLHELSPGYHLILVLVHITQQCKQLILALLDLDHLRLLARHHTHDLTQGPDEHVHKRKRSDDEVKKREQVGGQILGQHLLENARLVCQRCIQEQAIHCLRHILKATRSCW
mmetsp:Transcript_110945/g.277717  ORF Transcript_110945/g.277717 Transcript_110945/m.277717 type:complete len:207 (+) Transcript_110945:53-673(+)